MNVMGNRFIFHLKQHWFDLIWSGRKRIEYREVKPYWTRIVSGMQCPTEVVFQAGYNSSGPRVVALVERIDQGECPIEGWNGVYYRFHFRITKRFVA